MKGGPEMNLRDEIGAILARELDASAQTCLIGGDPPAVVVRLADEVVSVGAYVGSWIGPHTPAFGDDPIGSITVQEFDHNPERAEARLADLIRTANAQRQVTFAECEECGRVLPPEWMDEGVCQSCSGNVY